jgi:hypothetical protein
VPKGLPFGAIVSDKLGQWDSSLDAADFAVSDIPSVRPASEHGISGLALEDIWRSRALSSFDSGLPKFVRSFWQGGALISGPVRPLRSGWSSFDPDPNSAFRRNLELRAVLSSFWGLWYVI